MPLLSEATGVPDERLAAIERELTEELRGLIDVLAHPPAEVTDTPRWDQLSGLVRGASALLDRLGPAPARADQLLRINFTYDVLIFAIELSKQFSTLPKVPRPRSKATPTPPAAEA